MPPLSSLCVIIGLFGVMDEKELAGKTASGFNEVMSVRRTWRFQADDVRFNVTAAPQSYGGIYTFNGKPRMFLWNYANDLSNDSRYEQIKAVNLRYGFHIARAGGNPWLIKSLETGTSEAVFQKIAGDDALPTVLAPDYSIFVQRWDKVVSDPTFKIMDFKKSTDIWLLSFVVNGSMYRGNRVTRGKVEIDPRYFSLNKYEAEIQFKSGERAWYKGETQYDGLIDGIPVPRRHEYKTVSETTGSVKFSRLFQYRGVAKGDLSGAAALLSAYGLPEPAAPTRGEFPIWVLIVMAGVLCLGLAVWVKKRGI